MKNYVLNTLFNHDTKPPKEFNTKMKTAIKQSIQREEQPAVQTSDSGEIDESPPVIVNTPSTNP